MDRIAIVGGARLNGAIQISGAKNSAIKLMVASLLTEEPLRLTNMPRLADTRFLGTLLTRLGTMVDERDGPDGSETLLHTPEIITSLRALRSGSPDAGQLQCAGAADRAHGTRQGLAAGRLRHRRRPVDLHLKALEALGAQIELTRAMSTPRRPGGLKGARIEFPFVSVGATEHVMLAAVLAKGRHGDRERRAASPRSSTSPNASTRWAPRSRHRHLDHHHHRGLEG
jgi:UDP-N-acetylglucosamine 1-carboxyvinyltransferase